jgi:hypothetical protein
MMLPTRCALISLLALAPAVASAAPVPVASATASSTYPADGNVTYDAKNIVDGKAGTAWVEGASGAGMGESVTLDFGGDKQVAMVKIWGGMWYSADSWQRSNRPKQIELVFSDDSKQMVDLNDAQEVTEVKLSAPKSTSSLTLRLKGTYSGSTFPDTAISEVQVFDAAAAGPTVRGASASSTAPPDGDSYEPGLAADGLIDTMWCEGNQGSDGTGEWLELQLGGKTTVSKLHLLNGIGSSMTMWFKGNRATKATLAFDDGSTESVEVKNTFKMQEIAFAPRSTGKVRITFDEVSKGKEYNDLCISEAYLGQ